MEIESKELSDYIQGVLNGVNNGIIEDYNLKGSIEFELAIVNSKETEGGLKIHVAKLGADYSKEETSKIKFEVTKKGEYSKPRARKIRKFGA